MLRTTSSFVHKTQLNSQQQPRSIASIQTAVSPRMVAQRHHSKRSTVSAQAPCGRCRAVLSVCWLQVFLLQRSSGFLAGNNGGFSAASPSRTSSTSMMTTSTTTTTGTPPSTRYWDTPQPNVPEKFLRSIREEPWRGMFEPCVDHALTEIEIEGKVPDGLKGTLFRNSCGRNRDGDRAYGHWFDGDGHIAKVVFKDGKVYAQNRFVSTDAWDPDAPEGRGSAGAVRSWTRRPGGWLKNVFKLAANLLNTSVMLKGGKLYALSEGGKPSEMDPVTLETLGERDLGGIKGFYSAHPTCDESTGETFSLSLDGPKGTVEVARLSPAGTLDASAFFAPPGNLLWHDSTITEDFVVGLTSPFMAETKDILAAIFGFGELGRAFKWDDTQKAEVLFFSRDTLELAHRVELPDLPSVYHIINGYQEEGDGGKVAVFVAKLREGGREKLEAIFRDVMGSRFSSDVLCDIYKYEIDVAAGKVLSHGPVASVEGALPMELPTIDSRYVGKRNRFVYTNGILGDAGFLNCVQRVDLEATTDDSTCKTHDFGELRYGGEPIFVSRSEDAEEGDGYLIVLVYNAETHTTDVEVLDARNVDAPPLCVAHVPWHFGTSFHGIFTPQIY